VHRVPGGERSGVFAYIPELDHWLRAADADPAPVPRSGSLAILRSATPAQEDSSFSADRDASGSAGEPEETAPLEAGQFLAETDAVAMEPAPPPSSLHALNAFDAATAANIGSSCALPDWHQQPAAPSPPVPASSRFALLRAGPRRVAYGIALSLALAVAAGGSFAYVHFQRIRRADAARPQPSPEAQELYLRGRYFWNLRTEDGLNRALDLFTQSIVNDPHYAAAYAGLADSYLLLRQYGHMADSEAYPRALAAARQAVALDPSSPDAHRSLAFILRFWNWDMPAAEQEFLRAIQLDPKNSQSHHWYATALLSSGRVNEALEQIDIARALEPQSVSVLADRGLILSSEDLRLGAQALQQIAQAQPEFVSTHQYLANIDLDLGDYAGFLDESRAAAVLSREPAKVAILDQARKTLATRGPRPMLRSLAADYAELTDRGQVPPYLTARLFGISGDAGQAMRYLRLACDRRDPGFLSFDRDPAFQLVRSSPEYLTLLARRGVLPGTRREPLARLDLPQGLAGRDGFPDTNSRDGALPQR
jgi:tetratricopeptide (TPR) repeat protein